MTTPGYFDVKVSDGKHALFDVKLDDLSGKNIVSHPHNMGWGGVVTVSWSSMRHFVAVQIGP